MKVKATLIAGALLLNTITFAANTVEYATPTSTQFADKGRVVLNLKSNPTTGYFWRWVPQGNEANYVNQITQKYIDFPHPKGFVGGGGYEQWTFRLNKKLTQVPTQITLHMLYARIRAPINAQPQSYTVMITPATD